MKMLLKLLLLFVGLSSTGMAKDVKYPVSAIPKSLLKDARAVLRISEESFTVVSPGKAKYHTKKAFTLFDKTAEELAFLRVPYDKFHTVLYIKGTLYVAMGQEIKSLKKSDIKDIGAFREGSFIDDVRYKIAVFENFPLPCTVEFEFEIEFNGLMFYPDWDPYPVENIAVESSTFKVNVPRNIKLRYKEISFDAFAKKAEQSSQGEEENVKPAIQTAKIDETISQTTYTWNAAFLPVYKEEPFSKYYYPMLYLSPSEFEIAGYKGDMSSWKSLGLFINQLNSGRDGLSAATKDKIKKMVEGLPNNESKIKKIYEYMQSKTRYVGIQLGLGGWQPLPADFVDEKGYGDCKALSNYTKSLLNAAGIPAFYTLISADRQSRPVFLDFPTAEFNHVVLSVPNGKDTLWLECTSQTKAFAYVSTQWIGDRYGLMITPEGGKIVKTGKSKKEENLLNRTGTIRIDAEGNALVEINTQYHAIQEGKRAELVENSNEEQKKWLYDQLSIPSFEILDFKLNRKKSRLPVTEEKLRLSIRKFAAKSGKRMSLQPNLLNRWERMLESTEHRTSEVYLNNNYDFVDLDQFTIQMPEGYDTEYIPEAVEIKTKFGVYQMSCQKEQNKIHYQRRLEMNAGTFPAQSYSELVDFFKKIAKSDKNKIVLINKTL